MGGSLKEGPQSSDLKGKQKLPEEEKKGRHSFTAVEYHSTTDSVT